MTTFQDEVQELREMQTRFMREPLLILALIATVIESAVVGLLVSPQGFEITASVVIVVIVTNLILVYFARKHVWAPATVDAREVVIRREASPILASPELESFTIAPDTEPTGF